MERPTSSASNSTPKTSTTPSRERKSQCIRLYPSRTDFQCGHEHLTDVQTHLTRCENSLRRSQNFRDVWLNLREIDPRYTRFQILKLNFTFLARRDFVGGSQIIHIFGGHGRKRGFHLFEQLL